MSAEDFASKVRAKYPGVYDHLQDQELTAKVLQKYPEYSTKVMAPGVAQSRAGGLLSPESTNVPSLPLTGSAMGGGMRPTSGGDTGQMTPNQQINQQTYQQGQAIESAPMVAASMAGVGTGELPLLARAGIGVLATGGTSLAMGNKPKEAAMDAATLSVGPELGGGAISKVAEKLAPAIIRNYIKPTEQMFAYGKDPVKAVMDLPGVPATRKELATKVFQELENTGNQINSKIQEVEKMFPNAPTATKVDIGRAINNPIDKKIAEISADRGMEASVKKGVIDKLEDLRAGIMTNNAGKAQPTVVKMSTANQIKQQIGKGANWKIAADPIEAKAQPIVNGLRKEIYSNIRQGIETQADAVGVKGLKEANSKYGSLLDAQKSLEKRMNTGPVVTMSDLVTALASPQAAIVKKTLSTAPGAAASSKALRGVGTKAGQQGVSQLLRQIAGMLESNPGQSSQPEQ